MPNIASALKEDITRLARKELRASTDSLRKTVTGYRSEIAALKRRIEELERQQRRTGKTVPARQFADADDSGSQHRWRAAGFAKHPERLGLSAADLGKLLRVSALTVYKWESGKARPRAAYLPAIAQVRAMGKREASRQLEALES